VRNRCLRLACENLISRKPTRRLKRGEKGNGEKESRPIQKRIPKKEGEGRGGPRPETKNQSGGSNLGGSRTGGGPLPL